MSKKRKKKQEAAKAEPREPATVARVDQAQAAPVTKVKYESGLDAILRRARERALQQLREKAVSGR